MIRVKITIIEEEQITIDGFPYVKRTYNNGASVLELNIPAEPQPEPEPQPQPVELIPAPELDEAYEQGVNAYQGE